MMRGRRTRSAWPAGIVLVSLLSLCTQPPPARAQARGKGPIAVMITYKFGAQHRPAVRETMITVGAPQFEKWKSQGVFKDYLILFPTYVHMNSAPWDMLLVLHFDRYADTANWKRIERTAPGGLPAKALEFATPVSTYLSEVLDSQNLHAGEAEKHVYTVSPYKFKMGGAAGIPFVNSYVLPQLAPFVRDQVLSGYGLYLNLHDLSDWSYMIIFQYADTAAFGTRSKAGTRQPLTENPAWRSLHELKMDVREELPAFFNERLLPR